MSPIDFIIVYLFLFSFFAVYGKFCSKSKSSRVFWARSSVAIVIFSLIEGLRYCRGVDYFGYMRGYLFPDDDSERGNAALDTLNAILRFFDCHFVLVFVTYSFIFIVSAFLLLRCWKQESKYMFAFLLPLCLIYQENLVRQNIAFSFVLIGMAFLIKKRYYIALLFGIIALWFHIAVAILILSIVLAYFVVKRKYCHYTVVIAIDFLILFIINTELVSEIATVMTLLDLGDSKYQAYVNNADRWFSDDNNNVDVARSQISNFVRLLSNSAYYYLGYYCCKLKKELSYITIYNISVVGFLFVDLTYTYDIIVRMFMPLQMLSFIILGSIYLYKHEIMRMLKPNILLVKYLAFAIPVVWYVGYVLRWIFVNPDTLFVWSDIQDWNTNLHSIMH